MESLLEQLESGLAEDPISASRDFIVAFAQHHAQYTGQPFWIDTTPASLRYADYVFRLLPNARFIDMRRHPLDTIASVIREPWGPDDPIAAMTWWRDCIALAEAAKARIPASCHLTLHLEDLVLNDRERSYAALLDWLELDDHPKMRQFFEREMSATRAHIGRWRDDFADSAAVQAEFERIVGPVNPMIGY